MSEFSMSMFRSKDDMIEAMQARIDDLSKDAARVKKLEQDLINEAKRTAEQKLRADQIEKQHKMQARMHSEAANELAKLKD